MENQEKENEQEQNIYFWGILGCISCGILPGLVLGWPGIREILLNDVIYSTDDDSELKIGLIWTTASWTMNGSRFFGGFLFDYAGPRKTMCFFTLSTALGIFMMGFATNHFTFLLAINLISTSLNIVICVQNFSNLFVSNRGVYSVLLVCCIHGSSYMGLVAKTCIVDNGTSRKIVYSILGIVAILLACMAGFIFPDKPFPRPTSIKSTGKFSVVASNSRAELLPTLPFKEQLCSPEYLSLLLFFSLMMIPAQYYMMIVGKQSEKNGKNISGEFLIFFSIFSFCAFVNGKIIDLYGFGATAAVGVSLMILCFTIFLIDRTDVQYIGFVAYAFSRNTLFGSYFANIGVVFGHGNYGRLVAVGILSTACASLFQFALLYWGSVSGMEKSIYFTIGLTICCYFYVIYMIRWEPKNYVQEKDEKMNDVSLNELKTNQQNFI